MAVALVLHLYDLSYFYIKYEEGENIHQLSVIFFENFTNSWEALSITAKKVGEELLSQ